MSTSVTKKSIMTAIKRAVSPLRQASTEPELQLSLPNPTGLPATTPFTRYVLENLNLENGEYKMFAMTFAPQIQMDCEARVLDFDDYFHLLGHKTKGNALRTLLATIEESELIVIKSDKNSVGRPRDIYRLSINQMEEVLLAANTEEGKRWRKMVLRIKNLVVEYMKMEMEEQTTRLAMEEAKRAELEAVQAKLQATIESQRKREEKKEARKKQQKEPLETAYLMTNMPDDNQGPYKCGKTGGDAKKRAKEMQTGNHEAMRVVASTKCVDSKLVEDVMHRIFRDYRTNDKLEWFDTNLKSMKSVLNFVVEVIDGLNRIDHDVFSVSQYLEDLTALMKERISNLPLHDETLFEHSEDSQTVLEVDSSTQPQSVPTVPRDYASIFSSEATDPFEYFVDVAVDCDACDSDYFTMKEAIAVWKTLKKHDKHKGILKIVPTMTNAHAQMSRLLTSARYLVNAVITNDDGDTSMEHGVFAGCRLRYAVIGSTLERNESPSPASLDEPITTWLSETFERTDGNEELGARQAYEMFKVSTGLNIVENDFNAAMRLCGVGEIRHRYGRYYRGLVEA